MKLLLVIIALFVAAQSTVVPIPGGDCNYQCPVVDSPVCGTDGRTYPSTCHVECYSRSQTSVSVGVKSPGRCPERPCICPAVVDPVCGTNGLTYNNRCELECDSAKYQRYGYPPIYVKYVGKCKSSGCVCAEYEQLVCGTNGRTYGNPCKLNCESKRLQGLGYPPIFIASYGRCPPQPCKCPPLISPVCGTNGKTYRNTCYLECASRDSQNNGQPPIKIRGYGPCKVEVCICTADVRPVCASDGKTYNNECALKCQNDRRLALGQSLLTKLYDGPCKSCICPLNYDPVCGSDDKEYGNLCELQCENKRRQQQNQPPLSYTKGKCGCNCAYIYKPVCASDFKTYPNECSLGCENRRRVHNGMAALYITQYGECSCNCFNDYLPVCGSDRRTYWNVCWFNCANFYLIRNGKPAITISKNGPC